MSKPKIAVIIAATRDHRFGPTVAQWIFDIAHKRDDIEVTLVDLKTVDLPFFNEGASNAWTRAETAFMSARPRRRADSSVMTLPWSRRTCIRRSSR